VRVPHLSAFGTGRRRQAFMRAEFQKNEKIELYRLSGSMRGCLAFHDWECFSTASDALDTAALLDHFRTKCVDLKEKMC